MTAEGAGSDSDEHREPGSAWSPLVVAGGLLVLGGVLLWQALVIPGSASDASGPKLMPVAVAVLWLLLSAAYAVAKVRDALAGRVGDDITRFERIPQVGLVLTLLIAYAYLLQPLGYLVATTVFFVGASRVLGSRSLTRDLVVASGLAILIYFTFSRALGIYLPPGVIPL